MAKYNPFIWVIKKLLLNWEHPIYSRYLYEFSKSYLDIWYGDNNFNRETNGEFHLLRELVPKCSVVFDVGANIGFYSNEILSINPKVKIHAFEPDTVPFKELTNLPVVANNIGLGDKEGNKILYRDEVKSTFNSFYDIHDKKGTPLNIRVETIDGYCTQNKIDHIDFVKIDVEGYEYYVIKGAERMIKEGRINYIQFEFSGATTISRTFLKDFIELFNNYGYDVYRIKPFFVEKVLYYPDRERFTLTNYLAVKRGLEYMVTHK